METRSNHSRIKKINVIGTSGSGKSTFGKRLAAVLFYPYVEMDKIFWGPNWKWPTDEKFFSDLSAALAQETWVLDGNYNRSIPTKWKEVELVIWLDYSFSRTLFQAVKRALKRSITKEELWEGTGNRESFRKSFFSKESIIWWTMTTHKSVRLRYERFMNDPKYSHIEFLRLKHHGETEDFLKSF